MVDFLLNGRSERLVNGLYLEVSHLFYPFTFTTIPLTIRITSSAFWAIY